MKQEAKFLIQPNDSGLKLKFVWCLELKEDKLYVFKQEIPLSLVLIMLRTNGTFSQRF